MPLRVCSTPGCPTLTQGGTCSSCSPTSTRNHGGVSRHRRGLGADHDRNVRAVRAAGLPCEIQRPGCTGIATSPQHRIPRSRGGTNEPANLGAACAHCQNAEGAELARVG